MRKFNRKIALKSYFENRDYKSFWVLLVPISWPFLPLIIMDEIVMLCSVLITGKVDYWYGYHTVDYYEEGMKKERQEFIEAISKYEKNGQEDIH
jgi:hypothetical protein